MAANRSSREPIDDDDEEAAKEGRGISGRTTTTERARRWM